jgi:hypothetical protein
MLTMLVAPPVPATATAPELGEFTSISGDSTARIEVSVPADAWFESYCGFSPDVTITGTARTPGVVFVRADGTVPSFPILKPPAESKFDLVSPCGPIFTIPAGIYELILLADQGSASVSIHLHGLAGTADLNPVEPLSYETMFPDPIISTHPPALLYEAGGVGHLASNGMLFTSMWTADAVSTGEMGQLCFWTGEPNAPPGLEYGPGCPSLSDAIEVNLIPNRGTIGWAYTTMPAGTYALGGWMAGPFVAQGAGTFSFWLGYS